LGKSAGLQDVIQAIVASDAFHVRRLVKERR
jgi:hypothetical protein